MTVTETQDETLDETQALTAGYALRRGVYLIRAEDGTSQLNAWPRNESVGHLSENQRDLLRELAAPGAPIPATALAADDERAELLTRLRRGGWLDTTYAFGARPLLTVRALGPMPEEGLAPAESLRLRDDVVVRRDRGAAPGDGVVMERPGAWCDVVVHHDQALAVLSGLETSAGQPLREAVVELGWQTGLLEPDSEEPLPFARAQWRSHERWFHERSRLSARGYFGDAFGGTFWARDQYPVLPARRPAFEGARVSLPVADIAALRRTDPPFTAVLEDRSSVRDHDDAHPIDLTQLGEFLHRTSRVRYTREADGVEYSNRPYPSGGSMYELEVYPVIRHAEGVEAGMYHYDSFAHELVRVADLDAVPVQRMLRVTAHSTVAWSQPQVLLVVSARVGRVMWKYEAMAYALILKHVGVLYQTMYGVATAMGLAPCAVGSGDALAFSEATGTDSEVEPSVGEFLLGSRRRNTPIWEM